MWNQSRQKWLTVATVLCVIGLVLDQVILPPLVEQWRARSTRIAELKASLEDGQLLLDRETSIRERWQEMSDRALPVDRATSENEVINAVSRWAEDSHLTISSLKPRWARTEGVFSQLEIRATALGRPDAVLGFLYALERDDLPLCVESAKLTPRDERGRALALDLVFTALTRTDDAV